MSSQQEHAQCFSQSNNKVNKSLSQKGKKEDENDNNSLIFTYLSYDVENISPCTSQETSHSLSHNNVSQNNCQYSVEESQSQNDQNSCESSNNSFTSVISFNDQSNVNSPEFIEMFMNQETNFLSESENVLSSDSESESNAESSSQNLNVLENPEPTNNLVTTRSGRVIKKPRRLNL